MSSYKIVTSLSANTYKNIDAHGAGKSKNNTILMGSYVGLTGQTNGMWQEVTAFGTTGWIKCSDIGDEPGLKVLKTRAFLCFTTTRFIVNQQAKLSYGVGVRRNFMQTEEN
ncbi:MAG: hypothetical protein ABJA76_04135 [Mucilaginibacter sp.]